MGDDVPDVSGWGEPPFDLGVADRPADEPLGPLAEAGLLELIGAAGAAQRALLAVLRSREATPRVRREARLALSAVRVVSQLAREVLGGEARR